MNKHAMGGAVVGAAVLGGAALLAMNQQPELDELLAVARSEVPAVEVIKWGEDHHGLAKFDTRDGSIWRLNGDVLKPQVKAEWVLEVTGVGDRPIGTYRLQHANTAGLFLVDAVTGETWLLKQRAEGRSEWQVVKDYSSVLTSGSR